MSETVTYLTPTYATKISKSAICFNLFFYVVRSTPFFAYYSTYIEDTYLFPLTALSAAFLLQITLLFNKPQPIHRKYPNQLHACKRVKCVSFFTLIVGYAA